jgi:integrase
MHFSEADRDGDTFAVRLPKYGSERVAQLPDDLGEMLRAHIDTFLPDESPDRWLFTVGVGPMHDNDMALTGDPDVSPAATRAAPHLRHFHASGLVAAGCGVVTVQRALGHSSATTTLNIYSHLWPTAEDRTRAAAAGLMQQALGASNLRDRQSASTARIT